MRIPYYEVSAFTQQQFSGNPAGVCLLEEWLPDGTLLALAAENNLSETAFLIPEGRGWWLRWFSPEKEIDLCGHATLAAAHVLWREQKLLEPVLRFETLSGSIEVSEDEGWLSMDFPARPGVAEEPPLALLAGLHCRPVATLKARDWMVVLDRAHSVRCLTPDLERLVTLDCLGVIVTAPGDEPGVDFVSRFFAPGAGIPEDPVTGSTHCTLIPYWSERLGKSQLFARQLSQRGGDIRCTSLGERVLIGGQARTYLRGEVEL